MFMIRTSRPAAVPLSDWMLRKTCSAGSFSRPAIRSAIAVATRSLNSWFGFCSKAARGAVGVASGATEVGVFAGSAEAAAVRGGGALPLHPSRSARPETRASLISASFLFVELQADPRRHDHVELASTPRFSLERADLGRDPPILLVQRLEVGDGDAEARVVGPRAVVIPDEVEGNAVAPDPRHLRALPDDGEAQVLRVEGERRGQAVAGRNHRSHRAERRFHRNLPEGGVRRERLQEKRAVRGAAPLPGARGIVNALPIRLEPPDRLLQAASPGLWLLRFG